MEDAMRMKEAGDIEKLRIAEAQAPMYAVRPGEALDNDDAACPLGLDVGILVNMPVNMPDKSCALGCAIAIDSISIAYGP